MLHGVNIPWDGGSLNAVWTGDSTKPLLCFLHGSPGSWSAFENYLQDSSLLENFCMIAVDRPGFGYSEFGKPEPSLQRQSEAVMSVMDFVSGERSFFVAGHSLGGPLAIKMAFLNPRRIQGIILMAASVDPKLEPREFFRPVLKKNFFKYLIPTSFWVSNYEIEALMGELEKMENEWKEISCPVVSIHGTKDKFVPIANADYLARQLINSNYRDVRLQGKNHFIPWTAMDTIRQEIINFVAYGK